MRIDLLQPLAAPVPESEGEKQETPAQPGASFQSVIDEMTSGRTAGARAAESGTDGAEGSADRQAPKAARQTGCWQDTQVKGPERCCDISAGSTAADHAALAKDAALPMGGAAAVRTPHLVVNEPQKPDVDPPVVKDPGNEIQFFGADPSVVAAPVDAPVDCRMVSPITCAVIKASGTESEAQPAGDEEAENSTPLPESAGAGAASQLQGGKAAQHGLSAPARMDRRAIPDMLPAHEAAAGNMENADRFTISARLEPEAQLTNANGTLTAVRSSQPQPPGFGESRPDVLPQPILASLMVRVPANAGSEAAPASIRTDSIAAAPMASDAPESSASPIPAPMLSPDGMPETLSAPALTATDAIRSLTEPAALLTAQNSEVAMRRAWYSGAPPEAASLPSAGVPAGVKGLASMEAPFAPGVRSAAGIPGFVFLGGAIQQAATAGTIHGFGWPDPQVTDAVHAVIPKGEDSSGTQASLPLPRIPADSTIAESAARKDSSLEWSLFSKVASSSALAPSYEYLYLPASVNAQFSQGTQEPPPAISSAGPMELPQAIRANNLEAVEIVSISMQQVAAGAAAMFIGPNRQDIRANREQIAAGEFSPLLPAIEPVPGIESPPQAEEGLDSDPGEIENLPGQNAALPQLGEPVSRRPVNLNPSKEEASRQQQPGSEVPGVLGRASEVAGHRPDQSALRPVLEGMPFENKAEAAFLTQHSQGQSQNPSNARDEAGVDGQDSSQDPTGEKPAAQPAARREGSDPEQEFELSSRRTPPAMQTLHSNDPARQTSGGLRVEPRRAGMLSVDQGAAAPAGPLSAPADFKAVGPAAKPAAPPQESPFLFQLAERIQLQLQDGRQILRVQLNPESLGRLQIKAENSAAGVTATITAENAGVKAYIEDNLHQLQQCFQDQGLKIDRIEVTVQQGDWRQHPSSGHQDARSGSPQQEDTPASRWSGKRLNRSAEELYLDPPSLAELAPHSTFHTIA